MKKKCKKKILKSFNWKAKFNLMKLKYNFLKTKSNQQMKRNDEFIIKFIN